MIVGVDTYHDSAKKGRSVGAFIASMNQTLTRYYSNCGFQSSHEELQNNLCTFMLGTSSHFCLERLHISHLCLLQPVHLHAGYVFTFLIRVCYNR